MNLSRNDYYILDDHLNADGHNVISKKLSDMIDL